MYDHVIMCHTYLISTPYIEASASQIATVITNQLEKKQQMANLRTQPHLAHVILTPNEACEITPELTRLATQMNPLFTSNWLVFSLKTSIITIWRIKYYS